MKQCGSCKYFAQGKMCSFCDNKQQTDMDLKKYAYYNFGTNCLLFEEGIHQTRIDYMETLKEKEKNGAA